MQALINEIREYVNQEININKTIEKLDYAEEMARGYQDDSEIVKQAELLNQRYYILNEKLNAFVKISCEAFNITADYFIGCVNQYTEVLSYEK